MVAWGAGPRTPLASERGSARKFSAEILESRATFWGLCRIKSCARRGILQATKRRRIETPCRRPRVEAGELSQPEGGIVGRVSRSPPSGGSVAGRVSRPGPRGMETRGVCRRPRVEAWPPGADFPSTPYFAIARSAIFICEIAVFRFRTGDLFRVSGEVRGVIENKGCGKEI